MFEGIVLIILLILFGVIIIPLVLFFVLQGKVSQLQIDIYYLKLAVEKLQSLINQSDSSNVGLNHGNAVDNTQTQVNKPDYVSVESTEQIIESDPLIEHDNQTAATTEFAVEYPVQNSESEHCVLSELEPIPSFTPVLESSALMEKTQSTHDNPSETTMQNDETNPVDEFWVRLIRWFITGNPIAKVAVIILFLGLSYLLKYSIDHGLLIPEVRVLGSLVLGAILFAIGWRLRLKKSLYALILQGAAIGVFYLSIFAAFKLYALIPMLLAFVLLVIICSASVVFAVIQREISLAIIACVGGYLAPVLLSTGSGNHIALFSYYLLLSSSILAISFWQSWRLLNLIGFGFTFIVALIWGSRNFQPDFYLECQLFIIANMIIYGILAVLLSIRNRYKELYHNTFDMTLLFSVPLIAFSFQYTITQHMAYASAISALGFGLFYLVGSYIVLRIWQSQAKQVALYGIAIGLGFSTLAVPLALTANWTALVWLFEGTAISYIALSQRQYRFAWFGCIVVLLGVVSVIFALQVETMRESEFIILFGLFSCLLLFNACLWFYFQIVHVSTKTIQSLFIIIAALAWCYWIIGGIERIVDGSNMIQHVILFGFIVAVWLWYLIGYKLNWLVLRFAVIALWPILIINILIIWLFNSLYFNFPIGLMSWVCAFVSGYLYLYIEQKNLVLYRNLLSVLHISLLWLIISWLYNQVTELIMYLPWGFSPIEWSSLTVLAGLIILVAFILKVKHCFPICIPVIPTLTQQYWQIGLAPVAFYLFIKLLAGLANNGQMIYWTYIPIINPLELSAIFALMMLALWCKFIIQFITGNLQTLSVRNRHPLVLLITVVLVGMAFLWLNSVILRSLSNWLDISWVFYSLWHNNVVQVVLSLVWTLSAVVMMAIANHFSLRKIWVTGAVLQTLVVVKLTLVDSVELDGLMKAFVFIGVALLMLVIGYLAPLPPKINNKSDINQIQEEHSSINKEKE